MESVTYGRSRINVKIRREHPTPRRFVEKPHGVRRIAQSGRHGDPCRRRLVFERPVCYPGLAVFRHGDRDQRHARPGGHQPDYGLHVRGLLTHPRLEASPTASIDGQIVEAQTKAARKQHEGISREIGEPDALFPRKPVRLRQSGDQEFLQHHPQVPTYADGDRLLSHATVCRYADSPQRVLQAAAETSRARSANARREGDGSSVRKKRPSSTDAFTSAMGL